MNLPTTDRPRRWPRILPAIVVLLALASSTSSAQCFRSGMPDTSRRFKTTGNGQLDAKLSAEQGFIQGL